MNTLWQTPAIAMALITWLTTPPTTLGEISQREALRKSMTPKSAGSFTNDNLRPDLFPVTVVAEPPVAGDPPVGDPQTAAAPPATGEVGLTVKTAGGQDEKAWRTRISDARAALDRDAGLVEAMQSRINSLQADVVNRDDPAQQATMRQLLAKALGELERLKAQVKLDEKAILDIQADARRQGVPPGWVR
jgi:hypothetical protein